MPLSGSESDDSVSSFVPSTGRFDAVCLANPYSRDSMIIGAIPHGSRVLDVGCANGRLGSVLERDLGCEVVGVEFDTLLAAEAHGKISRVVVGDFTNSRTLDLIGGRRFDVVLFADTLEHVPDPWAAVAMYSALLAKSGRVIVSVPNTLHLRSRIALMLGRLEYQQSGGTWDRGHLRFFTHTSAPRLLSSAGLRVVEMQSIPFTPRGERLSRIPGGSVMLRYVIGPFSAVWSRLLPGVLASGFVIQGEAEVTS